MNILLILFTLLILLGYTLTGADKRVLSLSQYRPHIGFFIRNRE